MKKSIFLFLLSTSVFASALTGCGKKNHTNDNNSGNAAANTESAASEEIGTENLMEATEDTSTSQLQLGSAVEIPEGWDGELAETDPHGRLEQVIADYCNVAESDYQNVRYYYNYVDLNGDSKNEILALVLGGDVKGIDGNVLLWLDAADENLTKDSVKQSFSQVGAPVYISSHMTDGYRDLIIAPAQTPVAEDTEAGAGTETTSELQNQAKTGMPQNQANARTADAQQNQVTGGTAGENARTPDAELIHAVGNAYTLLIWNGDKYQDLTEGKQLENLDGYEGTAILTNNMESDLTNDNYHFLGEAMQ